MTRLKGLLARLQRSQPWRAWTRYQDARGDLLAGGVAYYAFFSIFPAIALAFTVFGIVLRDRPELLAEISRAIDEVLPGFVKHGDSGIIPIEAPSATALSWTGAIGVLGLLWAGLGWLGALRTGIRAIFGVSGNPGNVVTAKLRDLGVLAILGLGIVVSAVVTGVAGTAAQWVAGLVGLGDAGWVLKLFSIVVGVVLDAAIILVMLRLLSGVEVPWRGLWQGALVGGLGLTVLKVAGTSLLGAMNNPLFASIALVVGLLVWLNLMSRVVLVAAAWAANDLAETSDAAAAGSAAGAGDDAAGDTAIGHGFEPSPTLAPAARVDVGLPTFGTRAADRTTLAAGAVLGATLAAGSGAAWRLVRRVIRG